MEHTISPKLQRIFKLLRIVSVLFIVSTVILLIVDKQLVGQAHTVILCFICFITLGTDICEDVMTGESGVSWVLLKKSENPIMYYFNLVFKTLITIIFLSGFIGLGFELLPKQ